MTIKDLIKKLLPKKLFFSVLHYRKQFSMQGFKTLTYSGDGEDIILGKIFKGRQTGFYVDVGAFHPKYISNTFLLYKKGWFGINIDANEQSIELFNRYRPRDINVHSGISQEAGTFTYYNFTHFGVNTFDKKHAEEKLSSADNRLVDTKQIPCVPLRTILEKYSQGKEIDILDVDVEGLDLSVLKSNDWGRFHPKVILVEDRDFRVILEKSPVYTFLVSKGYSFHAYNNITLIMVDEKKLQQ